jgi:hypothetical protein
MTGFFQSVREDAGFMYTQPYIPTEDGRCRPNTTTYPGWWLACLWGHIWWSARCWQCCVVGHDWIDDSYGYPDTGCMAGHCQRCGYSYHHTLY